MISVLVRYFKATETLFWRPDFVQIFPKITLAFRKTSAIVLGSRPGIVRRAKKLSR